MNDNHCCTGAEDTRRALVLGEALVDIVNHPDSSDPVELPGGSPMNVAITLGRLGRGVELVTWLGCDERGQRVRDHIEASHVRIGDDSCAASHTSTAAASIGADGAATYTFDLEWQLPPVTVDASVVVAHSGSIACTLEPGASAIADVMARAREFATVTYDPNARPTIMGEPSEAMRQVQRMLDLADVIKVSDEDIEWLTEGRDVDTVATEWVNAGCALVVVTRGPRGASAIAATGRVDVPAAAVEVVDTVSAGDSFMGALIDALWSEDLLGAERRPALHAITTEQMARVLERCRAVSAVTVSRAGANPPWAHELA